MKPEYELFDKKMHKTLDVLGESFGTIRAGRASASVLSRVAIDYYGTPTPISQVGNISSPDPRTLVIQPWDASTLKLIEKAIQASEIGINPQNDGKVIRLCFPPLTEERRKELIKLVSKEAEEAKIAIRNVRRDAIDKFKDMKKKSEISEDDLKDMEKDMQAMTDKYIKDIDAMAAKKSKELSEV